MIQNETPNTGRLTIISPKLISYLLVTARPFWFEKKKSVEGTTRLTALTHLMTVSIPRTLFYWLHLRKITRAYMWLGEPEIGYWDGNEKVTFFSKLKLLISQCLYRIPVHWILLNNFHAQIDKFYLYSYSIWSFHSKHMSCVK